MKPKQMTSSDLAKLKHQLLHIDPLTNPFGAINAMADAFAAINSLQEKLGIWRLDADSAETIG